ncbi:LLM class flavin-dependent oxidoreductase [Actinoalloteichus fjordicus]|uniref:LLM class flavin-dependent oxidoreductase n=1 Tax=Actinoalloteichus fjordicus TaxID=1612552 RepID=UPI002989CC68|nr:LLM class flavin-dependent oxidoreductase [Actinoalloteichus fjordicus]
MERQACRRGTNSAVPTGTRAVPLLFGGSAPASYRRMAEWGEGYVAGSVPAPMVEPSFDAARQAWKEAGRDGSPRLVAIAYFAHDDLATGQDNVRDYYSAVGSDTADFIAGNVHHGAAGVQAAIESFSAIGADELIFHPAVPDLNEIEKLAEAVR